MWINVISTDNIAGELALINDKLELRIEPTSVAKFLNIWKKILEQKTHSKFSACSAVGMIKDWNTSVQTLGCLQVLLWSEHPGAKHIKIPWRSLMVQHSPCLVSIVLGKFSTGIFLVCRLRFQITDKSFCFFKYGIKSTLEFWEISPFFRFVHSLYCAKVS